MASFQHCSLGCVPWLWEDGTIFLKGFLKCLWLHSPPLPTIDSSSAPIGFSHSPPPRWAGVSGLFLKHRTHALSGSGSFPCSCETPHFCGQMPWQLEHRASSYRLGPWCPLLTAGSASPGQAVCLPACCARHPCSRLSVQAAAPTQGGRRHCRSPCISLQVTKDLPWLVIYRQPEGVPPRPRL